MQHIALYEQILGLSEPWRVKSVRLNREAGEVEIEAECTETVWGCPTCGQRMHVHEWERRRWRDLDSCQYRTILSAEVPRVKCETHGTQTVAVPWAEKHGRFPALFERLAIDVMLKCSVAAACEILRISWGEADGIKQRAVKRGLARKQPRVMARLCVDEKSVGVGQQYMNEAANEVRKAEHRRLSAQGDQTLTGARQLWLYGMENVPAKWAQRFAEVKETSLQTARAWAIKEVFRSFWLSADEGEAKHQFGEWYGWAMRSRLEPVKKVARMCKRHLGNILTFFKHRLTSGPIEGLNNRIQGLIKKACGYRIKERFKTDVLFHLGGLDLHPAQ